MRRKLVPVAVLLLGGAIVNVAVAWGCAVWSKVETQSPLVREPHESDQQWWQRNQPFNQNHTVHAAWLWSGFGVDYEMLLSDPTRTAGFLDHPPLNSAWHIRWPITESTRFSVPAMANINRSVRVTGGFPLRSVSGERWDWGMSVVSIATSNGPITSQLAADSHSSAVSIYLDRPPGSANLRMIGFRPIWFGFVFNTIFYAAILWLIFVMPFALRRARRIKRGLCPACAYPVGTSPVCTECGAQVPFPLRGRVREGVGAQTQLMRTMTKREGGHDRT